MQSDNYEFERMRNDPGNYKWGIFYYNKKDPRALVPKRSRLMGWTLNFANPYSWLVIILIVAFASLMDKLFSIR